MADILNQLVNRELQRSAEELRQDGCHVRFAYFRWYLAEQPNIFISNDYRFARVIDDSFLDPPRTDAGILEFYRSIILRASKIMIPLV